MTTPPDPPVPYALPSPSPLAPEADAPRQRRPWTILGRLSQAVREQNWFAVVLEVLIVIVGVVVGFQVTGWGQARADRAAEQTYLGQLAADLRETERDAARHDSITTPSDIAGAQLLRWYARPDGSHPDSLLIWVLDMSWADIMNPVIGTATALMTTGDLRLIRNDSLRSSITSYLDLVKKEVGFQQLIVTEWTEVQAAFSSRFDRTRIYQDFVPAVRLDSLARADPLFELPSGPRRPVLPLPVDSPLSVPGVRAEIYAMNRSKKNLRQLRQGLLEAAIDLRERVEAEIDR